MCVQECLWGTEIFVVIAHMQRCMQTLVPTCGAYITLLGLVVSASCILHGVGVGGAPHLSCSSLLGPGNPLCILMMGTHLGSGEGV